MAALGKSLKKDVQISLGLIQFTASVHSVREEIGSHGLVRVCEGLDVPHAPSRIGRTDACKACHNVAVSTFVKGRPIGDSFAVLTKAELEELGEVGVESKRAVKLRAHKKADMASTVDGEKIYYLAPQGNVGNYATLMEVLRQRPDLSLAGEFNVRTEPGVYALRLLRAAEGDCLVLQELCRPGQVRDAPAVDATPDPRDVAAALGYVDSVVEPYDPDSYMSERGKRIEELLADRAPVGVDESTSGKPLFELLAAAVQPTVPRQGPRAAKKTATRVAPVRRVQPVKTAAKKVPSKTTVA